MRLVAKSTELSRLPRFMLIVSHNSKMIQFTMQLAPSHSAIF